MASTSIVEKRPVGRPPKYNTQEERHEARKNQFRFYKKKVYEAEKQIRNDSSAEQKELLNYLRKNIIEPEKANEILAILKRT
jgi:ribosomal protein L22